VRNGETLAALFEDGSPEHPALITAETGSTLSYAELRAETEGLAARLAGLGIGRRSTVAVVLPAGPAFLRLLFAIVALGATAAPLNPAYKRDEYDFYLDDLQPELLLLPADDLATAREAASGTARTVRVVDVSGSERPELVEHGRTLTAEHPYDPATPNDVALLLHTSGTTSRPKQVPLTQGNLMASARTIAAFYDLGPGDVSYCVMPLFHVHGLVASTFAALAGGGTVAVPTRFTPRGFWTQARQLGVTWFSAGPTLHQMLLDRDDGGGAPDALRFARSCSSALSPALMERLEGVLGVPVLEAYGMTEASHQMASNPLPPAERKPGTVGIATGVEIRILDKAGNAVDQGSSGEVAIRGPGVTAGYLANPTANAEAFTDGWFRTGDRGSLDPDGYLRLEGRLKELILRGGENISPYEIEAVLLGHPAVSDAICFGVDDDKYGERVGAAVVLNADAEADERDLIAYCRERLAAFKVPEVVHVLDAIPRTPTGKVQRKRVGQSLSGPAA